MKQQVDSVVATGEVINQFDFTYDAVGNITEEKTSPEIAPETHLEMTYQAANRLAIVNGQTVQFDADGNMIHGLLAGTWTDFGFDSRNRLVQAGETVYRYDAEDQRIGVDQTQFVVNSQPALSQVLVQEKGGVKTFYIYSLGLIGEETDGQYRSYHFDYRGNTVALTDKAGSVVERFQYAPYGELIGGDATKTSFLFNGMYGVMTDGNGLYYMRARFYNPEIKRFVNQDILLGSVVEGQTLNRFAFVTGNPIKFVDPFGLEPWDGQGDISICRYHDKMNTENPNCSYYSQVAQICRGENKLVNGAMGFALLYAWEFLDLNDSQSEVLTLIRTTLVSEDIARRIEGIINRNGCVMGNDIDEYHDFSFKFAGLSSVFYGGNLWPQGIYPNPIPYDCRNTGYTWEELPWDGYP